MAAFIKVRNAIRRFLIAHELVVQWIWHGALVFASLYVINQNFGYLELLNHTYVAVMISLLCAFIPLAASGAIIGTVLVLHLTQMSLDVALVTLVLIVVGYLVCGFYRGRRSYYIMLLPVLRQFYIPYTAPMEAGLLGSINEISSIICGAVMSFYLNDVKINAALLIDPADDMNALKLLLSMIQNRLFYIYVVALAAMFVVIYVIKFRKIKYAWVISVFFGVLTEFLIMLAGYTFSGLEARVPQLVQGSLVTLVFGVLLNYFFRDLDYSRVENVQFEDDEYYYYVTAVPKNRIEEEQKKVTKITEAM